MIRAAYSAAFSSASNESVATNSAVVEIRLLPMISNAGTTIECDGLTSAPITVLRDGLPVPSLTDLSCPFVKVLAGDFVLSSWNYVKGGAAAVATNPVLTGLPHPIVLSHNLSGSVVVESWVNRIKNVTVFIAMRTTGRATQLLEARIPSPPSLQLTVDAATMFQWVAAISDGSKIYTSNFVTSISATIQNLGYVGSLSIGNLGGQKSDQLIGYSGDHSYSEFGVYKDIGLDVLFIGRDFRDLRVADFDGNGLDDVISNVYGSGCTMVGLNLGNNQFKFSTPLREDGTCIGGHGETMVLGDFNEDGLIDVFIPTYERWDLLLNQGNGVFKDVAVDRGIEFANYLPPAEGAAAIDIDLDGHVDIVAGNEILLNDGTGHFKRLQDVYGTTRQIEEGLFVGDLDNDGYFDIVKQDPWLGPQVFWGGGNADAANLRGGYTAPNRRKFLPGASLLGGQSVLTSSYGIAAGSLTGSSLQDIVIPGGAPYGTPPVLCVQYQARSFNCADTGWFPNLIGQQEVVLVADFDGSGAKGIVERFEVGGTSTLAVVPSFASTPSFHFGFDIRDPSGSRTLYGRAVRIDCAATGNQIALTAIDGGNGYMSQGAYTISIGSDSCDEVKIVIFMPLGPQVFGPFATGTYVVNVQ